MRSRRSEVQILSGTKDFMLDLNNKIKDLSGVSKILAGKLKFLQIETVKDLIFYFPFRYESYENTNISDLKAGTMVNIFGTVELISAKKTRYNRKNIVEALVSDNTGSVKILWFNQPWLTKNIKAGQELFFSGKIIGDNSDCYLSCPNYSFSKNFENGLLPIYSLTSGLNQKHIRSLVKEVIKSFEITDHLSTKIIQEEGFLNLKEAIVNIHYPVSEEKLKKAKERISFDEIYLMQFASELIKNELSNKKASPITFDEKKSKDFISSLGFNLTIDQKKATWEIIKDLGKEIPMNRMLEGDVGSGKTIVAFIAVLNAYLSSLQTVLMVPTEVLAKQHYESARKIFKKEKINIAILARSFKSINGKDVKENDLIELIKKGKVNFIIGTHAVIQEKIQFLNLGLVIVDEQHRFGVEQRKLLKEKNLNRKTPHFLSMTATPIPRSLALICYGDLDLSIIKQMPSGRRQIITKVVPSEKRRLAYEFIKKQIVNGRQVFIICPLVDPSDFLGVKSVKEEYEKLDKTIFPELLVGLLHGKMKAEEKEKIMREFIENKIKILVSTSVIEVGIDVPNANVMMIEGSERFGLAQLHQFRGRVGRGMHQSYCFLFSDKNDEQVIRRLNYMASCNDGFKLANYDLETRGGGSIYSTKQSGFVDFKIADINDIDLIKKAKHWAAWSMANEDKESINQIKEKISDFGYVTHRE